MRASPLTLLLFAILATLCLMGYSCERDQTPEEKQALAEKDAALKSAKDANRIASSTRDRQIAQAASNLGPIGDAVSATGQPALGDGIHVQKANIDNALAIAPQDYPAPAVSLEALLKDAQGALVTYKAQATDLQHRLDEANTASAAAAKRAADAEDKATKAKADADAAASTSWWITAGTTAVTAAGFLAATAARLGLPGAGLIQTATDLLLPAMKAKRESAVCAVAAADVGRQAMAQLECYIKAHHPETADTLCGMVSAMSGGKADGLDGLFKLASKAFVTDEHGDKQPGIDALLCEVRGRIIPTAGGVPTTLAAVLSGQPAKVA